MVGEYKIENTNLGDLEFIYGLFDQSILYQEKKGVPVWRNYDKGTLLNDVKLANQYKVTIDGEVAIVFSVCYSYKILWREMETGDSIYLHRIVVNPLFKGRRLFGRILDWAIGHAKQKGVSFIRIDTWAKDIPLKKYYEDFGFYYVGDYMTPDTDELPEHNRNLALTLLQYDLAR
jgi:GNAT superfamily N-acetyltransferase